MAEVQVDIYEFVIREIQSSQTGTTFERFRTDPGKFVPRQVDVL